MQMQVTKQFAGIFNTIRIQPINNPLFMKKQNLILSLFLLTILLGVSSCGDDDAGKASKEEVKAAFQSANDQISNDLNTFNNSSGYGAMNQLSVLVGETSTFGRKSSLKREQVIENFKAGVYAIRGIVTNSTDAANARTNSDEPFDYNEQKGVYEWNSQEGIFVFTGDSEIIEIHFPTEGSITNDAEFRLTAYAEESTPNGDELYSPTLIKASILVDDTKELELNAEVEYGAEDQPVKGDVYYFVNPFALEIAFDDTGSTSSTFSESLSKSGKVLIGFGATVNFQDASKDESSLKSASGYFQLVDIKLVVSAKMTESTSGDINDFISISIKVKGKSGGKIILEQDETTGEIVPYVKYTDGSTEPLEDLLADLSFEIEDMVN
jgi:hypothetical protein